MNDSTEVMRRQSIADMAAAWEQAKALLETAKAEGRELSAEEEANWQRANADLDSADERIRSLVLMVCLRGLDSSDGLADLLSQRVEDTFAVAENSHRTPRFQRYSESR